VDTRCRNKPQRQVQGEAARPGFEFASHACHTQSLACNVAPCLPSLAAAGGPLLMPRTIKIPVVVLGPDRHFGVAYAMRHSTAAADAAEVDDDEDQHHRCVCVRVCAGGGGGCQHGDG
jgi:hypothetical protein